MTPPKRLAPIAVAFLIAGCDLPRDPRGTLERVQREGLRTGVTEEKPWTARTEHGASGIEVELVQRFAQELGTEVRFTWGAEQRLFESLERYELDLVIGGLTDATPWSASVGLTKPYFEREVVVRGSGAPKRQVERHVMAVAPGENGFLRRLERFLRRQHATLTQRVEQVD